MAVNAMSERVYKGFRIPIAVVVAGMVLIVMAGATVVNDWQTQGELGRMSDGARRTLFERVRETLRSACPHAKGEELRSYCSDQAQFLALFPECDGPCQALCKRYAPQPTK